MNDHSDSQPDRDEPIENQNKLSAIHVLTSVFAAAIGVQSRKNQQKDFSNKNSIYIYVIAGIVFTALFVLAVYLVVKLVLATSGI